MGVDTIGLAEWTYMTVKDGDSSKPYNKKRKEEYGTVLRTRGPLNCVLKDG